MTRKITLRDHRRRKRPGSSTVRAEQAMVRERERADVVAPRSAHELGLASTYLVKRPVVSMEQGDAVRDIMLGFCEQGGVEYIGRLGVSLFGRRDMIIALRQPDMQSGIVRTTLEEYVAGFSAADVLTANIGRIIITGARQNQSGERFLGLGLTSLAASRIRDEQEAVRGLFPGLSNPNTSRVHISLAVTNNQQAVEAGRELLEGAESLLGSAMKLGPPEFIAVKSRVSNPH